jgi:hypothetical protein
MIHPHLTTELTRARRDELLRAAQARRSVRAARPRTAPGPDLVRAGPARWIAVLRWALRRPAPALQPPC